MRIAWSVAVASPLFRSFGDFFIERYMHMNPMVDVERLFSCLCKSLQRMLCSAPRYTAHKYEALERSTPSSKPHQKSKSPTMPGRAKGKAVTQVAMDLGRQEEAQIKKEMTKVRKGRGVTIRNLMDSPHSREFSWDQVVKKLDVHEATARFLCVMRIVFWHWLQPLVYLTAVFVFYDDLLYLDRSQFLFPAIMLTLREIIYFIISIACAIVLPTYLLVDTVETFKSDGNSFNIIIYILAPEKLVVGWLLSWLEQEEWAAVEQVGFALESHAHASSCRPTSHLLRPSLADRKARKEGSTHNVHGASTFALSKVQGPDVLVDRPGPFSMRLLHWGVLWHVYATQ